MTRRRGTVVELAEPLPSLGLLGELRPDAVHRVQVEHAELAVTQSLVAQRGDVEPLERDLGGLPRTYVRRHDDDLRPLVLRQVVEPARHGLRLLLPGVRERYVRVTLGDVDEVRALLLRRRRCDVARRSRRA